MKSFGKLRIFLLVAGVWTFVGASFALISLLATLNENRPINITAIFLSNLLRFYLWGVLSPLVYVFVRKFDFQNRRKWLTHAFIHIALALALSFVHSIAFTAIIWIFNPDYAERYGSILQFFQQYVFFGSVSLGIMLYALIVAALNAVFIYRNFQAEERRAAALQTQLAESRLQALKMQLQPHFLFNTLHSISSLVVIDPPRAGEMLARLGEFLRLTLEQTDAQMVSLEEEIEFARAYLEIEQTRFRDRLRVSYDVESAILDAAVPHLILQPLVENAVKHGIAPFAAAGEIQVKAFAKNDELHLQIRNSFPANATSAGQNVENGRNGGKGLKNVEARLAEIYGANHEFRHEKQANDFVVNLRLPKN